MRVLLLGFAAANMGCSLPSARYTGHNIEEIAVHRIAAVTVGTLWGLFVTRQIFPYEARKELRHGLSEYVAFPTRTASRVGDWTDILRYCE